MEEGYYRAGHFQAIVPSRSSDTLTIIEQQGGFDVAEFLELDDHGELILYGSSHFHLYIKF